MGGEQQNNPLHGITLEQLLSRLVAHYQWAGLAERIRINCFVSEPSLASSLKFLRKTPWARQKVEQLYLRTFAGEGTLTAALTDSPWRTRRRP